METIRVDVGAWPRVIENAEYENYREQVAAELQEWFERNEELQDELEQFLRRAWRTTIVTRLQSAAGNSATSIEKKE